MEDLVKLNQNHFELFGLPVSFDVNIDDLTERYRKLQARVHPDKFADASELERRLAVQHSAQINEAYQTLKHPMDRAKYLLLLQGIDLSQDHDTSMDGAFLMRQMELREALADISQATDPAAALLAFSSEVQSFIGEIEQQLAGLFARQGDDEQLQAARDGVRKLQFLYKLLQDADALEESLY